MDGTPRTTVEMPAARVQEALLNSLLKEKVHGICNLCNFIARDNAALVVDLRNSCKRLNQRGKNRV